jgi:hypothetical protein
MAAPFMNDISDRYKAHKVGSVFLYTHEAHPGEYYPHHKTLEEKMRHARDLRDLLGVNRSIFVDALNGACHRAYGSMPNMTWIFTAAGIPVYKSDWTDSDSVDNALEYFLQVFKRRREGARLAPFRVERLDYRNQDQKAFYQGLERSGQKAVQEFRKAFG